MFGSGIKLDKALLARVKRYADLAGYSSVEEFMTHCSKRRSPARRGRLRGRDQEEAERPWLHLLSVALIAASMRALDPVFDLCCVRSRRCRRSSSLAVVSRVDRRHRCCWSSARTSDQRAHPRRQARRLHAALFEIRLFNDDLSAIFRAQAEMLRHNLTYLRLSLVPMIWMFVPLRAWSSRSWSFSTATTAWRSGIRSCSPLMFVADTRRTMRGWRCRRAFARTPMPCGSRPPRT